jgi:TolB-like protein
MAEDMQRKLLAILSIDVVGYSRLMGKDEVGTITVLRNHRGELVDPTIADHGGRIVKSMGDGLLVEFPSVVNATKCAIEIQEAMAARNAGRPETGRMIFRIGVNLGDIVIDGDDILGDGVNVAARLLEISEPGGIAISRRVFEDVRDRLDTAFLDAGEQTLKNIARPVQIWRWKPGGGLPPASPNGTFPVPQGPSIAVLPFDNMSGDPEQEYFSDGITEDIITALSKFRWFFVSARNSTFSYKGQAVDIKQIGRDLGVRYVLEGSVRKAGNRVRVTAQLIESETGNHIWAERYDRDLVDIFDLQDDIQQAIVSSVEPELSLAEHQRATRTGAENLTTWDLCHQAMWHLNQRTREDTGTSERLFQQAIAADRNLAMAHAGYSWLLYDLSYLGFVDDPTATLKKSLDLAEAAVKLDERLPLAHVQWGRSLTWHGDTERAIEAQRHGLELNPNFALGYQALATSLYADGQHELSLEASVQAIRLSPRDPLRWATETIRGLNFMELGDMDAAETAFTTAARVGGHIHWTKIFLANLRTEQGRLAEAQDQIAYVLLRQPELTVATVLARWPIAPPKLRRQLAANLGQANLPP